jgi:hypothetical protein
MITNGLKSAIAKKRQMINSLWQQLPKAQNQ